MLASYLTCVLVLVGAVHALDLNKRINHYIHTSRCQHRVRDSSETLRVVTKARREGEGMK